MSPLAAPSPEPRSLARFPAVWLEAGATIVRIHRRERSPVWFNCDAQQRFDLASPHGTLYAAAEPLGGMVEVFRDLSLIDLADIEARRLSTFAVRSRLRVADCTARGGRRFGITAAIHSTPDYAATQSWAVAFHRAGFAGIRYLLSHDPAQRLVGHALFGSAGEGAAGDVDVIETVEIQRHLLDELTRELGIVALPRPIEER